MECKGCGIDIAAEGAAYECSLCGYVGYVDKEIVDLRTQLTAALAERDEARERVKELEAHSDNDQQITTKVCAERDRLAAQLDTAWQQGAEVMRGAATNHIQRAAITAQGLAKDAIGQSIADILFNLRDIVRALPVPERKEG